VELDRFRDGLPPHFRMKEPDKTLDASEFRGYVLLELRRHWAVDDGEGLDAHGVTSGRMLTLVSAFLVTCTPIYAPY
jgi:hypothetical protein